MTPTQCKALELAAKAANLDVILIKQRNTAVCEGDDCYEDLPEDRWYFVLNGYSQIWNPLIDDGDALRLAVKLDFKVLVGQAQSSCGKAWEIEADNGDPYAATRRAIVRAAAEIGRNMK